MADILAQETEARMPAGRVLKREALGTQKGNAPLRGKLLSAPAISPSAGEQASPDFQTISKKSRKTF